MNRGFSEILIVAIVTLIGVGSIVGVNTFVQSQPSSTEDKVLKVTPSPVITSDTVDKEVDTFVEFPFMELTIPYYRSRDYKSLISELDLFEEKSNYTSYTTSYDSDGLKINSYLTIPKGNAPEGGWPAIVFIHGYIPPTIYRTTQNYVNYVDYFARNGFVVIKPDLRGHDNSEGEAFGTYYSGGYIIDTLNALSAIKNFDSVNPNKVGLWGHSMGGNIVFRTLVADQNIPAAVIWAGAVYTYEDFSDYRIEDNSYRPPVDNSAREKYRQELNETYGDFDADDEFWQKVVPTNYLDNINTSIQIHHSVNDNVVRVDYSRNLEKILKNTDIKIELKEYPGGGHNIISPYYEDAMKSSVDFYNRLFGI